MTILNGLKVSGSGHLKKNILIVTVVVLLTFLAFRQFIDFYSYIAEAVNDFSYAYKNSTCSKNRSVEVAGWNQNKSLWVEDYLQFTDSHSFLRQPVSSKGFESFKSRFCSPKVEVIILVASSPKNLDQRTAIRETWGSPSNLIAQNARIVFGLGFSDSRLEDTVVGMEAAVHDDIVQDSYVDSYNNLTLKTLSLLKWVKLTCSLNGTNTNTNTISSGPKFLLKTDDSVFVNVNLVNQLTQAFPYANIIGSVVCNTLPVADPRDKYYLPEYMYSGCVFPGYALGQGYLLRSTIIPTLLSNARRTSLVHLEDVYVTGLIARQSYIYPHHYQFIIGHLGHLGHGFKAHWVIIHSCTPNDLKLIWSERKNESVSTNEENKNRLMTLINKNHINC